jgi:hypothetical protein
LRQIRGCDARIRRESGAYVTHMLRAHFAYDVRHVDSVRKKMAAIKFEINPSKKVRFEEGLG